MSKHSNLDTWFLAMGLVLTLFFSLITGRDLGQNQYINAGANGLLTFFWAGFLIIMHLDKVLNARLGVVERVRGFMDDTLREKNIDKHIEKLKTLGEIAEECAQEVLGNTEPHQISADELNQIESLFHKRTGKYMRSTGVNTDRMGAEISDKPFDKRKSDIK